MNKKFFLINIFSKFASELSDGVIGNTADFGSVVPGSSPGRTTISPLMRAFFFLNYLQYNFLDCLFCLFIELRNV